MSNRAIKARITVEVTISHGKLTIASANKEVESLVRAIKQTSLPYNIGTPLLSLDSVEGALLSRELHPEIPDT